MPAAIIDGNIISAEIFSKVKADAARLTGKGVTPCLTAVQLGDPPSSNLYTKKQKEACESAGIRYVLEKLPESTSESDLFKRLDSLGKDKDVHGIILQTPLPDHIDTKTMQMSIPEDKDIEGLNPGNLGHIVYSEPKLVPCTAMGAFELIKSTGIALRGKEAVVVGCSVIVGRPLALLLLDQYCTTQICRSSTVDLKAHCLKADILVAAMGKPEFIKGDWVKEGAIVIDVGINRVPDLDENGKQALNSKGKPAYKTVGDVEFEPAKARASMITPVPGGVGPMTVAILLRNTISACKNQLGL